MKTTKQFACRLSSRKMSGPNASVVFGYEGFGSRLDPKRYKRKAEKQREDYPKDPKVIQNDWLVWYSKGGTVQFMPSEFKTLGAAKRVMRRLRNEGYEVWAKRGVSI